MHITSISLKDAGNHYDNEKYNGIIRNKLSLILSSTINSVKIGYKLNYFLSYFLDEFSDQNIKLSSK